MIQSPTLKQINYSKPIKKSKSPKLHIPLNLNKEQYYPANPLIKNKYILNIVEEADSSTSSPLKRRSSLLFKAKSAKNLVIKFNEKNQFSPIEEEKEKVRSRNTLIPRNNLRTQTISSEKFQKKNNYEERILTTPSNFAKKEKNTSFTNMDISRTLSRKDVKDSSEINAIRFINSIKRNKDNKFKINFLKTNEFDIKTLESPHNMDKSSLFLRNQMINLKKMEKLDPVEQMIWAIKHNHIHKVF